MQTHKEKVAALVRQLWTEGTGAARLAKDTSNLFRDRAPQPAPGHFNRLIERKLSELGGVKWLYSDSFDEPDEFWSIFDKVAYDRLKAKYDPKGRLSDLYRKCVLRE